MKSISLKDRVRGCLAGVAVGDAFGMPVEILSHEEIMEFTANRGLHDFIAPVQVHMGKKFTALSHLPAGHTTDDWQLTSATARSLIESRGFSQHDQAVKLVEEVRNDICGWGRTTERSARRIERELEKIDWSQPRAARDWTTVAPPPKKGRGSGNGVAMRIAPLALFRFLQAGLLRPEPLLTEVMGLALQTHGDPRAGFGAVAVATAINTVLHSASIKDMPPPPTMKGGPKRQEISVSSRIPTMLQTALHCVETRYRAFRHSRPTMSERVMLALSLREDPDRLRQEVGSGCFVLESVPFSLATALRHLDDFRAAVTEAANAGGDTDTNASMVGAIVGANVGLKGIPKKWRDAVPDVKEAVKLADRLYRAAKPRYR